MKKLVKSAVMKLTKPLSKEQLKRFMANVQLGADGKLPFDIREAADRKFAKSLAEIGIEVRLAEEIDGKGCWRWKGRTASINGIIRPNSVMVEGAWAQPYRSIYATWIGKSVPSDVHMDHRCKQEDVKKAVCVRPGHGHCIAVNAANAKAIEMMLDAANGIGEASKSKPPWGKPLVKAKAQNSPKNAAIVKAFKSKKTREANKAKGGAANKSAKPIAKT